MGVKWLLRWQPPMGLPLTTPMFEEILKTAEAIRAQQGGRWQLTSTLYRPIVREARAGEPAAVRDLFMVTASEHTEKLWLVVRQEKQVLEADASLLAILDKVQLYKQRTAVTFEGRIFEMGDFRLRLGRAVFSINEQLRGITLEVEYLPTQSSMQAGPMLKDFMAVWDESLKSKSLLGKFVAVDPLFDEFGLSDNYSLQHMALHYVYLSTLLLTGTRLT